MIVTIDGPAGAGKSTVARRLAERLGFEFLDTGAMYRAVAWAAGEQSVDLDDMDQVERLLDGLSVEISGDRVFVNRREVSRFLREPRLSQRASVVAAIPVVRQVLVGWQRDIASRGNYVCEGRDQGTVVFPDSRCKIFLTASPEIRAERRWLEMKEKVPRLQLDDVVAEQKIRDLRDETRETGRLVKADDAFEIRVDRLTLEEVVDQIEGRVRAAMQEADRAGHSG